MGKSIEEFLASKTIEEAESFKAEDFEGWNKEIFEYGMYEIVENDCFDYVETIGDVQVCLSRDSEDSDFEFGDTGNAWEGFSLLDAVDPDWDRDWDNNWLSDKNDIRSFLNSTTEDEINRYNSDEFKGIYRSIVEYTQECVRCCDFGEEEKTISDLFSNNKIVKVEDCNIYDLDEDIDYPDNKTYYILHELQWSYN